MSNDDEIDRTARFLDQPEGAYRRQVEAALAYYRGRLPGDLAKINAQRWRRDEAIRAGAQFLSRRPIVGCPTHAPRCRCVLGDATFTDGGGVIFSSRIVGQPDDAPLRFDRSPSAQTPAMKDVLGWLRPPWVGQDHRLNLDTEQVVDALRAAGPIGSPAFEKATLPIIERLYEVNPANGLHYGPNPHDGLAYDTTTDILDFLEVADGVDLLGQDVPLDLFARCPDHPGGPGDHERCGPLNRADLLDVALSGDRDRRYRWPD